jgi:hypothetical protein
MFCRYGKVCNARKAAFSSRQLIDIYASWWFQWLYAVRSGWLGKLRLHPQPVLFASTNIVCCGVCGRILFPFHNNRFCCHQRNSLMHSNGRGCLVSQSANNLTDWFFIHRKCWVYNRAVTSANVADWILIVKLWIVRADCIGVFKICWIFFLKSRIFCPGNWAVIVVVFKEKPRWSSCWVGVRFDFFMLIIHPSRDG